MWFPKEGGVLIFLWATWIAVSAIVDEIEEVTWCVLSDAEQAKCLDFASNLTDQDIVETFHCVRGRSTVDCMRKIQLGLADAVTLDGGDIYTAGRCFGLQPVAGEFYGTGGGTKYYAVAVSKKSNQDIFWNGLQSRTSCHTGMGRTAGWIVPIGSLVTTNQLLVENCDILTAVGNFFNQSCVPGIKSSKYNLGGTFPENLCKSCIGDETGANVCANGPQERYFGYSGAFRCLAENSGDVAFIRHSTVFENTDGRNQEPWAINLKADEFMLLCPNNSTAEIHQYRHCHLASVPSHAVVVKPELKEAFSHFLNESQNEFGPQSDSVFKMFSSIGYGGKDLLFHDDTIRLVYIPGNYLSWLGQRYIDIQRTFECQVTC
ncbi:otolith matrix protein 1-like isoform X2 [Protopterus annectens]|uniref:otolith matrix protein 1-like isoform X2 n=1 Tax=Protopterus annectens TaxID=7888 RepID=UPI001CFADABB|nr:otolith matrix protein 1-like isoform X2 [Protopterus annectens]